jgi:hypothetical protein
LSPSVQKLRETSLKEERWCPRTKQMLSWKRSMSIGLPWCLLDVIVFFMLHPAITDHWLNIFVFTHRSLRTNPCIMYLRAATVFGLVTSYFILPMRLIHSRYIGIDHCLIGWSHRSVLIVIYVVLHRWTREHGIVIASLLKRFLSLF